MTVVYIYILYIYIYRSDTYIRTQAVRSLNAFFASMAGVAADRLPGSGYLTLFFEASLVKRTKESVRKSQVPASLHN